VRFRWPEPDFSKTAVNADATKGGPDHRVALPVRAAKRKHGSRNLRTTPDRRVTGANGLSTRSCSEWSALWKENPAYRRRPAIFRLVGFSKMANETSEAIWVTFLWRMNCEAAGASRDSFFLGRRSRLSLPFARPSASICQPKNVDLFIYTTPNALLKNFCARFIFQVTVGKWDTAGFWITGYRGFARSVVRAVSLPSGFSYPVSAGLFAADIFRPARKNRSCEEFESCAGFDSRFDGLGRIKPENQEHLLASGIEQLWRGISACGRTKARMDPGGFRGKRIVAYAIFDRQDNPHCS